MAEGSRGKRSPIKRVGRRRIIKIKKKMIIRGSNEFYDGWLARLFDQPRDVTKSDAWREGWDMLDETPNDFRDTIERMIKLNQINVHWI